jgi:hypothetical protein
VGVFTCKPVVGVLTGVSVLQALVGDVVRLNNWTLLRVDEVIVQTWQEFLRALIISVLQLKVLNLLNNTTIKLSSFVLDTSLVDWHNL